MVTMVTATVALVAAEDVEVHHPILWVGATFPRIHLVQEVEVVAVVEEVPLLPRHLVPWLELLPLPHPAAQRSRRFKIARSRHCCKATSRR
jgi:hypothetical protein